MRNFTGFDTLPLVEFVPRAEIPAKKVMEFLKMDPPEDGSGFLPQKGKKPAKGGYDGWQQENRDEQTMQFGQNDDLENDLFTNRMLEWLERGESHAQRNPAERNAIQQSRAQRNAAQHSAANRREEKTDKHIQK